nr:hypothetical protein [Deltaproteobacteria bacterium]
MKRCIGKDYSRILVSVHRAQHLLCCRALEVQGVRLRTLRLASAAPCKRLQLGGFAVKLVLQFRERLRILVTMPLTGVHEGTGRF